MSPRMAFVALCALAGVAQALNISVGANGGNATSPLQYGIMFEVDLARTLVLASR